VKFTVDVLLLRCKKKYVNDFYYRYYGLWKERSYVIWKILDSGKPFSNFCLILATSLTDREIEASSNQVVAGIISIGDVVSAIAFSPSYVTICVANADFNSGNTTFLNTSADRILSTIDLNLSPYGLVNNSLSDYLYVTGYCSTASPLA
jgi:DNA-binding beta-propeller fold protein YncE